MAGITQSDLEWMRQTLNGRSAEEIARIKEVFAHACGTQPPQAPTLIDVLDDLADTRALFHALDLAFAGLESADRHALRTVAEIALDRLDGVCSQVEILHGEGAVTAG
jgi:hypothetical protein